MMLFHFTNIVKLIHFLLSATCSECSASTSPSSTCPTWLKCKAFQSRMLIFSCPSSEFPTPSVRCRRCSVTGWLDYLLSFGPFTPMIKCQISIFSCLSSEFPTLSVRCTRCSVTSWLDYLLSFWPFTSTKIYQILIILQKPFRNTK